MHWMNVLWFSYVIYLKQEDMYIIIDNFDEDRAQLVFYFNVVQLRVLNVCNWEKFDMNWMKLVLFI